MTGLPGQIPAAGGPPPGGLRYSACFRSSSGGPTGRPCMVVRLTPCHSHQQRTGHPRDLRSRNRPQYWLPAQLTILCHPGFSGPWPEHASAGREARKRAWQNSYY